MGEPLPAYEALPAGPERAALDYFPLFRDGELVAFALRAEGGAFQLDTALARGVGSLGPDRAALVFDRGACRVWDGASLGTAFEAAEPVDGRADLSEGVSPILLLGRRVRRAWPCGAAWLLAGAGPDGTAVGRGGGIGAPRQRRLSAVPLAAAGAVVLACLAAVGACDSLQGEEVALDLAWPSASLPRACLQRTVSLDLSPVSCMGACSAEPCAEAFPKDALARRTRPPGPPSMPRRTFRSSMPRRTESCGIRLNPCMGACSAPAPAPGPAPAAHAPDAANLFPRA